MKDRGFQIGQEDYELLISFAHPDNKNKIDYKEFYSLIMQGSEAFKNEQKN